MPLSCFIQHPSWYGRESVSSVCSASKASVALQVETLKVDLHQQAAALRIERENAIHEVDFPFLLQICCIIPNNSVCTQRYSTGIISALFGPALIDASWR